MLWIFLGVGVLAVWYFTTATPAVTAAPPAVVQAAQPSVPFVPNAAPSVTGQGGTPTTGVQATPPMVSQSGLDSPSGTNPAANPSNVTTPAAQQAMNGFYTYVTTFQHAGWNGQLTIAQWNYYYAQGSKTPTSASHEVGVGSNIQPSQTINVQTYWALRAAKGLSL